MKKFFLLIFMCALLPLGARAATATLNLSTGKENINALEATIRIPAGVHISSIESGDSMILIWVEGPTIDPTSNTIHFSGLTPGGFEGEHSVLKLTGDFAPEDISRFRITDVTALRNDGKGTAALVALGLIPGEAVTSDRDKPVDFTLALGKGDAYDGHYIVTFLTQDKGTGIDHYEYAVTYFGVPDPSAWTRTSNPVVLTGSALWKIVYVKAVDRSGNETITSISGPYRATSIFLIVLLCIISIVCSPTLGKRLSSFS